MTGKIANIVGATGLVGSALVDQLLEDSRYETIRVFTRRPTGRVHDRLEEHVVDFGALSDWESLFAGDELYSALGTTRKQAGSKEAQYLIDVTYNLQVAAAAAKNDVSHYLLVSASGSDAQSNFFYNRIKGELDEAVQELTFPRVSIFRPSLLVGERSQPRAGERVAEGALRALGWVPGVKRYRAIPGSTVAAAMVRVANSESTERRAIFALDEIFTLVTD